MEEEFDKELIAYQKWRRENRRGITEEPMSYRSRK